jgi:hypothetical protein
MTIKKVTVALFLLIIFFCAEAQKHSIPLNNFTWYTSNEIFNSTDDLNSFKSHLSAIDISSYKPQVSSSVKLYTILEGHNMNETKAFLEMQKMQSAIKADVNGKPIENLRSDGNFTGEIENSESLDELLLCLTIELSEKNTVFDCISSLHISTINQISLVWAQPLADPFFDGYLLEIHIYNMLSKDIDGKLIARVFDQETLETVAENNNCAFSRAGSEAIIDVNFPEAKVNIANGSYMAEIMLLDKENNEAIVDKITVPIKLNHPGK